ncbi:MAG: hypothetical protein MUC49_19765 [Raineya sp.]|jgi:hypothetical protein|nr:hypothetical protein [Raineya sp.]
MKISNIVSAFILLTTSFSAFGQREQLKTIKKIRVHDIYIQTGVFSGRNTYGTLADFKLIAPESVLLKDNMTGFSPSVLGGYNSRRFFSVMFGLQFSDKQKTTYKKSPSLRLGISYFSGTNLLGSLYKEDCKSYDTLISAQTGQTVYIDSVNSKYYNMNYSSQQLRFDGSLIFRTNPEARWSIFTGIGITAGFSINANTDIYYSNFDKTTRYTNGNVSYSVPSSNDYKTEKFRNKNNFGASAYIPIGIDFRIGKKREFLKRTHLFYELRPSINITSIPELQTITNVGIQHGLGLRISWG